MVVVKRNRREKQANFLVCDARCLKTSGGHGSREPRGFREASHFAVICGREVPLCSVCAAAWVGLWDGALDGELVA